MSGMRVVAAMLLLVATNCFAHIASNGFAALVVADAAPSGKLLLTGTLELAIRDGELAVGLDRNADGRVTWGELRSRHSEIESYVAAHFVVGTLVRTPDDNPPTHAAETRCALHFLPLQVSDRVDGRYLWLPFTAACPQGARGLSLDYRILDDVDPSHRGLLTLTAAGTTQTAVLGGGTPTQTFSFDRPSAWRTFLEYLRTGMWHIWSGFDHLLFLLSLLLPAVLVRQQGQWEAVALARPAFFNIVKVVTAFTLAHSITLSLAALDVVRVPARLTESIIAASIVVAALNNVFPKITAGRWRIAFAFGLLHGFGFASVLTDMGLPSGARMVSLIAFNAGVELGQLAVVIAVMPLAYLARTTAFYRRAVMPWGSSAIATLALVWLVQRAVGPV